MSLEVAQRNFDTNMKKIPWTPQLKQQYKINAQSAQKNYRTNLPISQKLVEQIVRNVGGADGRRIESRAVVSQSINTVNEMNMYMGRFINQTDIDGIQNKIRITEEALKEARVKEKSAKDLTEIRKEQAESLAQKYSSNLHSSYLGLWRPLKDDTHIGLNVASVMLGLIASSIVAYLVYQYWVVLPSSGGNMAKAAVAGISKLRNNIADRLKNISLNQFNDSE
jgi:hypothetical protein